MRSFFDRLYFFGNVALATVLVAGCVSNPPSSGQEETPLPDAVAAPSREQQAARINDLTRNLAAAQAETKQLNQQTEVFQKLLDDLARYPALNADEMRATQAELNNNLSSANPSSGGGNRIRLAYLLSLQPGGVNDQKAISMLDNVAKSDKALPTLRHLASVLRLQIQEKQQALQKLGALRDIDRRLLDEQMGRGKTSPSKSAKKPTSKGTLK
ncbi:MAG: hypothetical protein LBB65_02425 [Burkholderiales bacterium]|jgi:hypothetical protein|nr:hypothetical protein [Burkholderiales bacterium]